MTGGGGAATATVGSIAGGGSERIIFGANASGLSASQVAQVRFVNPLGFPAGSYTATILNTGEVVPLTRPPAITLAPTNQTILAGATVSLAVAANGIPALAYQWFWNGSNLPAATGSSLVLGNITLEQAGSYSVVITNIAGSTNTGNAVLSVYASAAPMLSGPVFQGGGQFQFGLTGVPGFKYSVWASTNLTDWDPLQTNLSPFIFTDTNSVLFPSRFYRALYLP